MPQPPEDNASLWKLIAYCVGVVAGLGAKLATMHKKNPLTLKDIAINSAIAFAVAYMAYSAIDYSGHKNAAVVFSVICGRFADDILTMTWKSFKKWFSAMNDEIEKK